MSGQTVLDMFERTRIYDAQVPEYPLGGGGCAILIPGRHRPPERYLSPDSVILPTYEVSHAANGQSHEEVEVCVKAMWDELEADAWRVLWAAASNEVSPQHFETEAEALDAVRAIIKERYPKVVTPWMFDKDNMVIAAATIHGGDNQLVMPFRYEPTVYGYYPSPPYATVELGMACLDPKWVAGATFGKEKPCGG